MSPVNRPNFGYAVITVLLFTSFLSAADDLVIADFEGETYAPWKTTGESFGTAPARGTLPNQMAVEGFLGQGLVNSFVHGDDSTGTLTSPPFRIDRSYIAFLVGGGSHPDKLALQLLVDGQVVRSSTGPNDHPGGSERLTPDAWDVTDLRGREATLRIVDNAQGGWGHINVDHIVQTDNRPKGMLVSAEKSFTVSSPYLLIPVRTGAAKRHVTLVVDGQPFVRNEIEIADDSPEWWAPMDVRQWIGKSITVRIDRIPDDSTALDSLQQSEAIPGSDALYREPLRAQFHFSPRRGWNNDPNGLVYYNGEYHLFFQHNPYGWSWGNMHWGHAVSPDLIHWQELDDPLQPDSMGPMFSGSAVVDWKNTSGLGTNDRPPLILFYTAAGNPTVQCLAWSNDGRTFHKYSGNPILPEITAGNRDPKVIWHEPTSQWVMVLYVEKPAGQHTIHFFTSPNLREWKYASQYEGDHVGSPYMFECPDLFPLPLDGNPAQQPWILQAADSQYAIGSFDGQRFTPAHTRLPGHRGRGFYAAQSFSDIPRDDGRRIQIGWFQTETKGMPFNQSMTVPLELTLVSTPDGPRLSYAPVRELNSLITRTWSPAAPTLHPGDPNPLGNVQAELLKLTADFKPSQDAQVVFQIRGIEVRYDAKQQEITVNGHTAPAPLIDGHQQLTILCDRTSLEVFASSGRTYVPMPATISADDRSVSVSAVGAAVPFQRLEVSELQSAWPR